MAKDKTAPRVDPSPAPEGVGAVSPATDPVVTHLLVSAKKDGFRRAGRAWSATPTEVSVDDFTQAQIDQLLAEPLLVVVPVAQGAEQ